MRLIDADSIPWDVEGVGEIPVITKEEIDHMPEAVVRCKDCKHSETDRNIPFCTKFWRFMKYCSSGKRKEE